MVIVANYFSGFYGILMTFLSLASFTIGEKYFSSNIKKSKINKVSYICKIFMTVFIFASFLSACINVHTGFIVKAYVGNENVFTAILGLVLSCAFFLMFVSLFCNFHKLTTVRNNVHNRFYAYTSLIKRKYIFIANMSFAFIFLIFFSITVSKYFFKYIVLGFVLNSVILAVYITNSKSIYDAIVLKTKNTILLYNKNKFDIQQQYRSSIRTKAMLSKLCYSINIFFIEFTGLVTVIFIIFIATITKVDYILIFS
jgi:hypothetical protein